MDDLEKFLITLQKGQIWMESMLDIGIAGHGMGEPRKIANETCKRKDFEHNAQHYLRHVPDISELIKPGMNDTKLKLKSKLSDIVLLGKEIIGSRKIDLDKTISSFKQEIQEISKEIEILKEELSLTKLKELEIRSGKITPNTQALCSDSEMVTVTNSLFKHSYSNKLPNINQGKKMGFKSVTLHDFKNSKWNININNPKYSTISEDCISLDEKIPRKCFWDRSQTSIHLISNLSRELQRDSLNNLLINSERSIRNINNMLRIKSYSDSLVISELFEALTRRKVPIRRCKEIEIRSESLQVEESEESKATVSSGVCKIKEIENLEVECDRTPSVTDFEVGANAQSDSSEQEPFYTPTTITVQQVTDMLFSLSNILEKIPDSLKNSKMMDLNPPHSMKNAISMLAHLSNSIDAVQLSKSFSFDDIDEKTESYQNMGTLERKLGQYDLHWISPYRVGCSKSKS